MTIVNREINRRLSNLERCAEMAPKGTHREAKNAADAIANASQGILDALRDQGFKVLNDDRLRNLEVAIYAYLLEANPDNCGLMTGEGFGEHIDGPAGKRIMAQTVSNFAFLRSHGMI